MPGDVFKCVNCIKMDYSVEEGLLPREAVEFDFAEDALDYETQLAEARDVKFTQTLTEPLSIGSHIICTGTPTEDLPWFAINIGSGDPETRGDIAVHFNVRLPQNYVVRNTRRHDKWGPEETTAFRLFPFKVDRPFTIEVLVDEKETLWAVDGEHYCSFAHRNPSPLAAGWVQVTGIRDTDLKIHKTDIYPTTGPPVFDIPTRDSAAHPRQQDEPIWRPNVIAKLPNGIAEGYQLVIYGRLRPMLHSFAIDLMDVHREWPRANILLHVNVRAHSDAQFPRQLVVLNASLGAWGPERRQRSARLVPATHTTIRIVRGPGEWSVYTDNVLIGELEYRASPDGVKAIRIRGDIYPEDIYVCPSTSSPIEDKK
ncbi:PREDICTED: galectin-8-like isoform X1 [Papilio xuthus]|uniref:Galectin n=1 Tax=Papilio xuthus TaxID=66420 RepID=A0AAJ6ZY20_PAPXU|nr:PREDICTED: galectin-8-like isoform X1 [Papilio xuthus]